MGELCLLVFFFFWRLDRCRGLDYLFCFVLVVIESAGSNSLDRLASAVCERREKIAGKAKVDSGQPSLLNASLNYPFIHCVYVYMA